MSDHGTWLEQLEQATDLLVAETHTATPDELPDVLVRALEGADGRDVVLLLADLQQQVLVPFQTLAVDDRASRALGIDSTVAGRAFQHMEIVGHPAGPVEASGRTRVWLPLLDGTDRVGVLGLTLPSEVFDDELCVRRLQRFATVLAELVVTKTMYGDSIVRARRTSPMSLAAEIQWSLLPPLTFITPSVTVAGGLEPAYDVGGDSLDYAVDAGVARFAIFDGMGHGLASAQLISLVVAAYRNARRAGRSLAETVGHVESAVGEAGLEEAFATGVLCELDTRTGRLSWASAGHHEPLLLRDGRLVRRLEVEPVLPFGLDEGLAGSRVPTVATQQLEPDDVLLLYTDGVVEARSPGGEFFGIDRLVDMVQRNLAAGLQAPETMRRVVHALLDHQSGELADDATLLLVQWRGPR